MSGLSQSLYPSPSVYSNETEGWSMLIWPANSATWMCMFPISGNYCLLPRILFYVSIIFALVGWGQDWLVGAALVSALLYSSCAAIHICLLAWVGPAMGEGDVWPIAAIVISSGIILVPLLNWSKTLRQLGTSRYPDSGSNARTVLIYWGFLIAVALFSILYLNSSHHTTFSRLVYGVNTEPISCTISNSTTANVTQDSPLYPFREPMYNLISFSTGQKWDILDADFVNEFSCSNVCQPGNVKALFRSPNDYQPLTTTQLAASIQSIKFNLSTEKQQAVEFEMSTYLMAMIVIPLIIVQGIWTSLFGRRYPRQVRDMLYIKIVKYGSKRSLKENGSSPQLKRFAMAVALIAYTWALTATILCLPVLLITIVAIEMGIQLLPQSESAIHIGAWTPWAAALLGLFASIVANFHYRILAYIKRKLNKILPESRRFRGVLPRKHQVSQEESVLSLVFLEKLKRFPMKIRQEWKGLLSFWRNADDVILVDRYNQVVREHRQYDEGPSSLALLPRYANTSDSVGSNPKKLALLSESSYPGRRLSI